MCIYGRLGGLHTCTQFRNLNCPLEETLACCLSIKHPVKTDHTQTLPAETDHTQKPPAKTDHTQKLPAKTDHTPVAASVVQALTLNIGTP